MNEHSIFPPSSMHRLMNCAGSFELGKHFPERGDSPASMEGTAAHWVCTELLYGSYVTEGSLAPNGLAVTDEMIEGAEMYVDTVPAGLVSPVRFLHIEERVDIPAVHEECFGTPDLWYFKNRELHVTDYKFGHAYVEVFMNPQMAAYAGGILDQYLLTDLCDQVVFTIVQPRCFHRDGPVRTWSCHPSELDEILLKMKRAAAEATSESARCVTGSWCDHCPAAHGCEALQGATQVVLDFIALPIPSEVPTEAKGQYLRRVKQAKVLLEAIESGLEDEIESVIRAGGSVLGYELQAGQGRVQWAKPIEEVAVLGEILGSNFRKEALITPTQARAALKKLGVDGSVIDEYSERKTGALKLVQTNMDKLRSIFQTGAIALNNKEQQND